jgi:transposase
MRPLAISDAPTVILGLQDEIRRNPESRYNHRLHGLLLVAQGMSGLQVAELLGDAPRTVQYWVRRFEQKGLAGLGEAERPGRPRRLKDQELQAVEAALRQSPRDQGLSTNLWDGKTLSTWIGKRFGIHLGVRQCQYLFRQLGFRLRKPRPLIARADPERQRAHKKNSRL